VADPYLEKGAHKGREGKGRGGGAKTIPSGRFGLHIIILVDMEASLSLGKEMKMGGYIGVWV